MTYKVFLSYSTKDMGIAFRLAQILSNNQITSYIAEWDMQPGKEISQKVKENIQNSDAFLVILTKDGVRSEWVNQEIGLAYSLGKPIVPLVENGVEVKGVLEGKEYIPFEMGDLGESINKCFNYIKSLKLSKERQDVLSAIGVLVLAGLCLYAISED